MKLEVLAVCTFVGMACFAQQVDLSSLDKLASKAKESRVITLDPDKLSLAGSLLDDRQAKNLVNGLKGIAVRSFEFAEKGMYSSNDLEAIRKQLTGPGWSKVIAVKEENEDVEVWFFKSAMAGGLTVISGEPRELTVVNITGPADLSSLGKLANLSGLSSLGLLGGGGKPEATTPKAGTKKDEE